MKKNQTGWLNLIFENRNKSYGAYELRVHYEERLLKSFAISLSFIALMFIIPFALTRMLKRAEVLKRIEKQDVTFVTQQFVFEKTDVVQSHAKPLVEKQPAVQHPVTTDAFVITRKTDQENKTEEKPMEQPAITSPTGVETAGTGELTPAVTGGSPNNIPVITGPMNAAAVDVAPSFPGGEDALLKYLGDNIHYSSSAQSMHITGKLFACFIVNEKGEIENVMLKNHLFSELDNEVIRVISQMPPWSPGIYKGEKVKTVYIVPVKFQLKDN